MVLQGDHEIDAMMKLRLELEQTKAHQLNLQSRLQSLHSGELGQSHQNFGENPPNLQSQGSFPSLNEFTGAPLEDNGADLPFLQAGPLAPQGVGGGADAPNRPNSPHPHPESPSESLNRVEVDGFHVMGPSCYILTQHGFKHVGPADLCVKDRRNTSKSIWESLTSLPILSTFARTIGLETS